MPDILLSICIPTFNRAGFLQKCLTSVMNQVTEEMPVEIIISDNCSNDNTQDVIMNFSAHPKVRSYRQNENMGAIKNCLKLIKEYSKGEFCWIIGDDDYIIKGGIEAIVSILQNKITTDFIFVKMAGYLPDEEFNKLSIKKDVDFEIIQKFEYLLHPKYSNVFLGELMAGIFRRKYWLQEEKIYENIEHEYLSTLETTYPHCVVYANQFMGKKALYISTPVIIDDHRAREWKNIAGYVAIEHLFTLLQLYKNNGLNGKLLIICRNHYLKITFPIFTNYLFNKKIPYRDKISFRRYFALLVSHPILTLRLIYLKIFNFISKV